MGFKDISGNDRVKRILRMALRRRRVPNSMLFCGPKGVSKTETAVTVAKALNCLTLEDDACDACGPCRAIGEAFVDPEKQGLAPDVMVISLREDKKKVGIDQIRLLKQTAYLRPMSFRTRVFIIRDADLMSEEASNSLLKVLEEPPASSYVILVTANLHIILPTIRSRCRTLGFSFISREDIERALIGRGFSADRAKVLSILARGSLETVLDLDWDDVQAEKEEALRSFLAMLAGNAASAFLTRFAFAPRYQAGDDLKRTMETFASFARDLILIKAGGEGRLLLNPDAEDALREAAGFGSLRRFQACLSAADAALVGLDKNMNVNLLASVYHSSIGESRYV